MAAYVGKVDGIDPCECRREVLDRWDVPRVARMYEDVYRSAVARDMTQRPLAVVN